GPILDRLLAAGEGLGDGPQRVALGSKQMQLLDLVLAPGLPMPLELFRHHPSSSSSFPTRFNSFAAIPSVRHQCISASSRPWVIHTSEGATSRIVWVSSSQSPWSEMTKGRDRKSVV